MTTATYITAPLGANPTVLYAAGTLGDGTVQPQFKLGAVAFGDSRSKFMFVKWAPGSTTSLSDGHVFVVDKDFTASLITTSNASRGQYVGVGRVTSASNAAGTYYLWLQIEGGAPVQVVATTPLANTVMETTATAGVLGAPTSATASSKAVNGITLTAANAGAATSVEAIIHVPPSVGVTN
jgi:hypothetical protein